MHRRSIVESTGGVVQRLLPLAMTIIVRTAASICWSYDCMVHNMDHGLGQVHCNALVAATIHVHE